MPEYEGKPVTTDSAPKQVLRKGGRDILQFIDRKRVPLILAGGTILFCSSMAALGLGIFEKIGQGSEEKAKSPEQLKIEGFLKKLLGEGKLTDEQQQEYDRMANTGIAELGQARDYHFKPGVGTNENLNAWTELLKPQPDGNYTDDQLMHGFALMGGMQANGVINTVNKCDRQALKINLSQKQYRFNGQSLDDFITAYGNFCDKVNNIAPFKQMLKLVSPKKEHLTGRSEVQAAERLLRATNLKSVVDAETVVGLARTLPADTTGLHTSAAIPEIFPGLPSSPYAGLENSPMNSILYMALTMGYLATQAPRLHEWAIKQLEGLAGANNKIKPILEIKDHRPLRVKRNRLAPKPGPGGIPVKEKVTFPNRFDPKWRNRG